MLKIRIIPVLCTSETKRCIKPNKFNPPFRILGPMVQYTKVMERRGVDEIVIVDVTASCDGRTIVGVNSYIDELFCPVSVGGGLRSLDDIGNLLRNGADKCIVGSGAYNVEGESGQSLFNAVIGDAAKKFGAQAVTVALDVYDNHVTAMHNGERLVLGNQFYVEDIARALEQEGAGEILLTTMANEGTLNGYDLKTIEKVSKKVSIPVVAHGGCGKPEHMKEALNAGAHAVAAGSMFLFTEITPKTCAEYLDAEGYSVRIK